MMATFHEDADGTLKFSDGIFLSFKWTWRVESVAGEEGFGGDTCVEDATSKN